ncbi:MAG: Single-stranded-DNA-specific exonuclease RecJ [Pseudomonadota bacterium]|jgi:single-stranded-DNA-specific exonuclease
MVNIVQRSFDEVAARTLAQDGLMPLLARVLAARGIVESTQLDVSLAKLIPPEQLTNAPQMAVLLADAIAQKQSLLVVGDYDCDGATATAVAIRGLRSMGAQVDYLVPNRFEYGYGLTPEIVELAAKSKPDIIITVDNGIASVDGVAKANSLGIQVLVTDHHLPGDEKPDAACIVNPNQHGCNFPSKNLAGVGTIFYVMLALRAELRSRGLFADKPEPNLTELLDIVALGTVADLVKLDDNNRILVEQGLRRIRAGKACAAIRALLKLAGRDASKANAQDLGFSVGPRLNAAGRLDDMALGIACLISDDEVEATVMAQRLHTMNLERRAIESDMQEAANISLEEVDVGGQYSLSIFEPDWHQGVIGILASRVKEQYHRPVIAFAKGSDGTLKGSGRSIKGLHLRDALDLVSKRHPNLILKFGGHAMAAGLTIPEQGFASFKQAFEDVAASLLTPADLDAVIETDGSLASHEVDWDVAVALDKQVWGQGFPPPLFGDAFVVKLQKVVGERHLKLSLQKADDQMGRMIDAIYFQQATFLPTKVHVVYELQTNEFNGRQSVQLNVRHCVPLE